MTRVVRLRHDADFVGWRNGARRALVEGYSPDQVSWRLDGGQTGLFDDIERAGSKAPRSQVTVPKAFVDIARQVVCHSDVSRFSLLYDLLWCLQRDKHLLSNGADPRLHRVCRLAKAVRRDAHKMKAFVRFRKTGETPAGVEQFVAWFEPDHHIVRLTADFFAKRFANMQWSILTPTCSAHWTGSDLTFSPGVTRESAPDEDALEDYWRSYYASIFNPARLKVSAMQAEMPKKYWKNLPEASIIPSLVAEARDRENKMIEAPPTAPRPSMMAHKKVAIDSTDKAGAARFDPG